MEEIQKIDALIFVAMSVSVLMGFFRGLSSELLRIAVYLFSTFLAYRLSPLALPLLSPYVRDKDIASLLSVILCILVVVSFNLKVLKIFSRRKTLNGVDCLLGAILSFFKALFFLSVLCFVFTFFAPNYISNSAILFKTSTYFQEQMRLFVEKENQPKRQQGEEPFEQDEEDSQKDSEQEVEQEVEQEKKQKLKPKKQTPPYDPKVFRENILSLLETVTMKKNGKEKSLFLMICDSMQEKMKQRGQEVSMQDIQTHIRNKIKGVEQEKNSSLIQEGKEDEVLEKNTRKENPLFLIQQGLMQSLQAKKDNEKDKSNENISP